MLIAQASEEALPPLAECGVHPEFTGDHVAQRFADVGASCIGLIDIRHHVSIRVGLPPHAFNEVLLRLTILRWDTEDPNGGCSPAPRPEAASRAPIRVQELMGSERFIGGGGLPFKAVPNSFAAPLLPLTPAKPGSVRRRDTRRPFLPNACKHVTLCLNATSASRSKFEHPSRRSYRFRSLYEGGKNPGQNALERGAQLPNTWRRAIRQLTERCDLRTVDGWQNYEYHTNGDGSG
jgi:hypothetical protein